jgi:hypothetical protein
VEAGDERGGDRVAVVLGEPPGAQAGEAEVGERRGRPFGPADLAAWPRPDRPGGGREGLDEAIRRDAGGLERGVELEPMLDPPVIGVAGEPRAVRRPADAADGASELSLVSARGLAGRRAVVRAVEGDYGGREVDDPGDCGGHVEEPLGSRDDLGPAHRAAVEPLSPPTDVDADRDHVFSSWAIRRSCRMAPAAQVYFDGSWRQ